MSNMGITEERTQRQIHFCFICGGSGATRHHLIPKATHPSMRGNRFFWRETVRTCRRCHDEIHQHFSHWELALQFNSTERLKGALKKRKEWVATMLEH